MRWRAAVPLLSLLVPVAALAAEPVLPDGTAKARQHMAAFKLPKGLTVELFAAEPMLASPVAISVDEKGRVFVAEEYRLGQGAAENRDNPAFKFSFWLNDELQLRTTDDRLKMYEKWAGRLPGGMGYFTKKADQVRLLEDTKGSGKADKSSVFAGGFNEPLDGLAAGVLARDGNVYFACIPSLWKMRDTKGIGVADQLTKMLTGFGVNCAFYGHDLHGLIFGPDGKLYFSIGDRGFNVTSKEGKNFQGLRTGGVFRCNPDGTDFEVVMRGLRNPQELAFDQYGNLFADDNNCDKGDHARLVYVVDDGDSGWNMAYQTIPAPYIAGPWFAEKMWHLPHAGQPAWIVPPVGKIGTGPSGFLFTSGTMLPDRYKNSFLMCNYAGGRGLESFKVVPKGAGFAIADYHDFLTPIMATDVDQGPDGKLYVSDFVNLDWSGKSLGGRIYTVFDPDKVESEGALQVKKLFADGFGKLDDKHLVKLLGHPEMKVRLRAQWALASGGQPRETILAVLARTSKDQLVRIHCIWAIGQIAAQSGALPPIMTDLLRDADPEIRTQAAKVIGMGKVRRGPYADHLVALLSDPSPRVKFFAAQSLGKLKHRPAVSGLFSVLAANKDEDPWLRHACVAALARIGDADAVNDRAADASASVRLGVVLVNRMMLARRASEGEADPLLANGAVLAKFLTDADSLVKAEAARAIHDLPLEELYPDLAKILPKLSSGVDSEATVRRALSAAYRLGTPEQAKQVLAAASNPLLSPAMRSEAIGCLKDWSDPPPRDRVTGFWRPLGKRDPAIVRAVVSPGFEKLLGSASGPLLTDVVGLIGPLKLDVSEVKLNEWVADDAKAVPIRVAALRVLADRKSKSLPNSLAAALEANVPLLKAEARDVLAATDPMKAAELLAAVLADEKANIVERQRALTALPRMKAPDAGKLLDAWAAKLAAGGVPAALRLDVLEALNAAPSANRNRLRGKFEASLPSKFAVSLHGGNAERGKEIFLGHAAAQCVRCHKVNDSGGAAGPDLSRVASRYPEKTREFFLESLLTPNAKIAPGFGTVTLVLADGRTVSGVVVSEDKKAITLQYPDGKKESIALGDVERRAAAASPMPSVEQSLSPREVRDLIEYLTTLK
ncbi:MAG TPA: PVC-type heme-binding CxxCH protein [Urbifossiella sp.]|nr:PVC-type heme-binding CxxCH protein [Urbifossiella sp.]